MTDDINFWTGIKDPYLKPDKPFLTESKELKVIKGHSFNSVLSHALSALRPADAAQRFL